MPISTPRPRRRHLSNLTLAGLALCLALPGVRTAVAHTENESAGVTPAPRTLDGRVADWAGTPTGLGGTSQYSNGELIYQDHLFDDLGPDTGARSKQHGTVSAPKGDFRYPTNAERYADNAADLLALRLAAPADDLWVLAQLSTLRAADTTVVALAFDTDADAKTGGGAWPHGAGLAVPGADVVVTLWGTGGSVTNLPGGPTVSLAADGVAASTDNADNAIEARVPLEALGGSNNIRVWAATGLWDPIAAAWMPVPSGSPTATAPGGGAANVSTRAWNVAFRDHESGSYMEDAQAVALKAGDISSYHADVDLSLLRAGASAPYAVEAGRFYAAIVDQGFSVPPYGEGLSYEGIPGRFQGAGGTALQQTFDFWGRYQPYGVYVPSTYDGRTPLPTALVLHGLGGSHSGFNTQPGFLRDMGEGDGTADQPPLMLVTPLGRGSAFYADWGEADTLAVLDDVRRRFPVDSTRLYLTGYSMGGYGVYRLASLHPDWFAAAASWAGYNGEFTGAYLTDPRSFVTDPTGLYDTAGAAVRPVLTQAGVGGGRQGRASIGDTVDTMENLRYLPLVQLTGTNDEIVPTSGQYAAPRRLAELGYRSRFDVYPGYEHFSFALVDDWKEARSWLGNQRSVTTPRQVTYKFSDGWTAPGLAAELGLVHDGAWWLRGLTMRDTTADGLTLAAADATSWGVIEATHTATTVNEPATAPTPHVRQSVVWVDGPPANPVNRLDLHLQGVGRARVDMAAAQLAICGLHLELSTDGPTTIELIGPVGKDKPTVTGPLGTSAIAIKKADRITVVLDSAVTGPVRVACKGEVGL